MLTLSDALLERREADFSAIDHHLTLAGQCLDRLSELLYGTPVTDDRDVPPGKPADEPVPGAASSRAGLVRETGLEGRYGDVVARRREDRDARATAASDALCEYLAADRGRAMTVRDAVRDAPQGLPGLNMVRVVRDAVVGKLGLLGIPGCVCWERVAKRLLSQLGESGDGYRVRCHVLALEVTEDAAEDVAVPNTKVSTYRGQGKHGNPWQGDTERVTGPLDPVEWWKTPYVFRPPVLVLEAYSIDEDGREYAAVRRPGKRAVVTREVVRD